MKIGSREIGEGQPPYVIAEIGVNHDGSAARALELTRLAADAGADAVKFQLFEADRLMSRAAKLAAYQKASGESDPIEMLRRLELTIDELGACVAEAHRLGVHAIVSVFSVELVEVAQRQPWDAYKTASPDIINRPLLEALASTGRPLIVSTGASTMEEIRRAVAWLDASRSRLAVLQCVSSYPTPFEHAELGGITALREALPGLTIGYSDHTPDDSTGLEAVRLGACILEKHFTDDTRAKGPDHAASMDPRGMWVYVQNARAGAWLPRVETAGLTSELADTVRVALTPPPGVVSVKRVLPIEQDVRTVSRQSLTTTRSLAAGHALTREDLTIKRPGTGLPPHALAAVLGKRLTREVKADMPVCRDDLAFAEVEQEQAPA